MKLTSLRYSLMAMGLLLAVACQPEIVRPEGEYITPEPVADLCQHTATVIENDCGLYLELEDGTKFFVRDTKSVELASGMKLQVGYSIQESSSSHSSGSGSCSNGSCGSSSSQGQADALENCMKADGVREATLSCISVLSSEETTG